LLLLSSELKLGSAKPTEQRSVLQTWDRSQFPADRTQGKAENDGKVKRILAARASLQENVG